MLNSSLTFYSRGHCVYRGTHDFFISVLDGDSHSIVFGDLRMSMTTADELILQRALETLPKSLAKPFIISDNGPQYLSIGFCSCLREQEVVPARIRLGHPQSNGNFKRFHKTLKSKCVRPQALEGYEEARKIIKAYVYDYNHEQLHSALNYLTLADYLKGEENIKQRLEIRKMFWKRPERPTSRIKSYFVRNPDQPDRCKPEKCHFR
ncbi:integrase [Leptospirillum ferriphilum YSK]|uniref:Integrase n=2 Tax=Leptospirillum ferriphilum TaxID=178606 RepID=A0A059XVI5_9BACT|nr:integrase [Leptospirillum ferriphilum YSK]